jgi:hypothetical protein
VTHLKPYHIGELIVCAILARTADSLGNFRPMTADQTLGESLATAGLTAPFSFFSDAPTVRVEDVEGKVWVLDGMHRVDVLATGASGVGVAFELKLGLDRLTPSEVGKRFQKECSRSKHKTTPRLNGSMVAVLERRFPFEHRRVTCGALPPVELAHDWWLVVRNEVWRRSGQQLGAQLKRGKVLILEDLVDFFGGEQAFDSLVLELVGSGFYREWNLQRMLQANPGPQADG